MYSTLQYISAFEQWIELIASKLVLKRWIHVNLILSVH